MAVAINEQAVSSNNRSREQAGQIINPSIQQQREEGNNNSNMYIDDKAVFTEEEQQIMTRAPGKLIEEQKFEDQKIENDAI